MRGNYEDLLAERHEEYLWELLDRKPTEDELEATYDCVSWENFLCAFRSTDSSKEAYRMACEPESEYRKALKLKD